MIKDDILNWIDKYDGPKFHAVLSDPPYELGFMGRAWDKSGIAFSPELWAGIKKHLYPGAYLMAFGGTRTYHRMACAIEDAGFEIRDCIGYCYGSGFPKSLNIGKAVDKKEGNEREDLGESENNRDRSKHQYNSVGNVGSNARITKGTSPFEGYGTALKPAYEPIIIARVPLEGTVAETAMKYGSGGLNIDGSRVGTEDTRQKTGGAIEGSGWGTKGGAIAGSELGRFPANLIHDGSDEVKKMFPNESDRFFFQVQTQIDEADPLFYTAKASKRERNAGLDSFPDIDADDIDVQRGKATAHNICPTHHITNCECGWKAGPRKNAHPTLKPISLTTYLAKLLLPPKEFSPRRLLVPFAGVASEMIGGYLAGWDEVVGVEKEKEYVEIGESRIKYWEGKLT